MDDKSLSSEIHVYFFVKLMLRIVLIVALVISGLIAAGSILLTSPKGGLGLGLGGMANAGEYGSRKSLEATFKKSALISGIIFIVIALFLPFAA